MSFDFSTLITDRTTEDVDKALSIVKLVTEGKATPEERQQLYDGLLKGSYDFSDLNRIADCMDYLDDQLKKRGNLSGYSPTIVQRKKIQPIPDENTLLLLEGESIQDSSKYSVSINNSGVSLSPEEFKFGESSLYFDGQSYLTANVPVVGDLTVDFWVYQTLYNVRYPTPMSYMNGSIRGNFIHLASSEAYSSAANSAGAQINSTFPPIPLNEWVHIALVRQGTTQTIYVNGEQQASLDGVNTQNDVMVVGTSFVGSSESFQGYIDEFRISNICRWTSNFVPPDAPYLDWSNSDTLNPYRWYREDVQKIAELKQVIFNVKSISSALGENANEINDIKTIDDANAIESILYQSNKNLETVKKTIDLGWSMGIASIGIYGGLL